MYSLILALLFVLRLKFQKPFPNYVRSHYREDGIQKFRRYEKNRCKLLKSRCDLDFLRICEINELTPRFLEFKLYTTSLQNNDDYCKYQKSLLAQEIESKRSQIGVLEEEGVSTESNLRNLLSFLDFNHARKFVDKILSEKKISYRTRHERKLHKLGLTHKYELLSSEDVVFNFSDQSLSSVQKEALKLGLKFCFSPGTISYYGFFSSFEYLVRILKDRKILECVPDAQGYVVSQIRALALKYYHSFRPKISNYHKTLVCALKQLASNKNIVISKPDKGTGIVLLNRSDYINKINDILQDESKFTKLTSDPYKLLLKYEDKNNRLVDNLFKNKCINENQKSKFRATGSRPGILYGLPKVHKCNVPLRPILSTVGSYNYNMAKWLVQQLSHLTTNSFSIKDSFNFVSEIKNFKNNDFFMASFDVTSLFTNIPVSETCSIVLDALFPEPTSHYNGFNRGTFAKILDNCASNNLFLFNNETYLQTEGAPMGGVLSPTLANVFLCYHEEKWLSNCPPTFRPVLYRRYVDDTFLLFRSQSHVNLFLNYINSQHQSIKFTCEQEKGNSLSFLDVSIVKSGDAFKTSVFRKSVETGLGLNFDSSISYSYKINLIGCLLNRASKICSTNETFLTQLKNLKNYFCQNSYPLKLVEKEFGKKLKEYYDPPPIKLTVNREPIYFKVPFLSFSENQSLKTELFSLMFKFYPQIDLKVIFVNSNSVGNFFKFKDRVPTSLQSNLVYRYTCPQCNACYVGETSRHLRTRIAEHRGLSSRTLRPVVNTNSRIFDHYLKTGHDVCENSFEKVVTSDFHLKTVESIAIKKINPNLNTQNSSIPLNIL